MLKSPNSLRSLFAVAAVAAIVAILIQLLPIIGPNNGANHPHWLAIANLTGLFILMMAGAIYPTPTRAKGVASIIGVAVIALSSMAIIAGW